MNVQAKNPIRLLTLSILLANVVLVADMVTPTGAMAEVLYVVLILASLWLPGKKYSVILASLVTVYVVAGGFFSQDQPVLYVVIANRLIILFAVWATAFLAIGHKQAELALQESEERYGLAVRCANDGLWDWDLESNKIKFSSRWKAMLGWGEDEIFDHIDEWFKRVHPANVERLKREIEKHIEGETYQFENDHQILHKDGSYRWVHSRGLVLRDQKGKAHRMAGSMTDITKRKSAEEQLHILAIRDVLTDLFNRRHFIDRLTLELKSAKRYGHPLSLCLCDLDHFKKINDEYGHRTGDKVLARFGRLLRNGLRVENVAARYGGDEFCIIFPHTDAARAALSVERIREHFNRVTFEAENGQRFTASATFGLADIPSPDAEEKDILEAADQALYLAKSKGRNCIEVVATTDSMIKIPSRS